ncbi:hypothetical protein EGM51_00170 [Verrucomicrobia bacterium S94]|nr:hypothetical protein EGM51_00170 [Verrucomicrobia bacterium S94]
MMMKRVKKHISGISKGAPSGFIASLAIHAAVLFLAGMLVVFNVVKKEEKKFVPPKPVDRPKMKLKKPKVKIKKSAQPRLTHRIVTKVQKAGIPEIQLPEMSGIDGMLPGDIGGFEILPDTEELTVFGSGQTIGSDFVGTFYDLKRDRRGRTIPMDPDNFAIIMGNFVRRGFRTSVLAPYYRSPKKLYATTVCIPPLQSALAPQAFGEDDTLGYCWAVHYSGQLVYPEDIRFRFWGMGDDMLVVRVDGEIVLIANWPDGVVEASMASLWSSSSADSRKYPLGNNTSVVGDWIELKAGEPLDMDVLIGEAPGGIFAALLCVEVDGVEYERNPYMNGPRLPIFKTARPSLDLVDVIHVDLNEGEASVREGPIFNDLARTEGDSTRRIEPVTVTVHPVPPSNRETENRLRNWTVKGKTIEAELVTRLGRQLLLKNTRNKQVRVSMADISNADRLYVELADPPAFNINFSRISEQRPPPPQSPFLNEDQRHIRISDYKFGVRIRQKTSDEYNHPVTVEYFALAKEVSGDKFKLIERRRETFIPSEENGRSFEFHGKKVRLKEYATRQLGNPRGLDYGGYLVTLTDTNGRIIQHETSHEFLFRYLENLKKLKIGSYLNERCERVTPTRPDKSNYYSP